MITHAHIISIYVSDQQRALSFWRDQMGFEVRENQQHTPQGRWITVAPRGAQTCLSLRPAAALEDEGGRMGGFSGIVFTTDNMADLYVSFKEHGVKITEEPSEVAWGISAIFADPDGNLYNVVEPKRP